MPFIIESYKDLRYELDLYGMSLTEDLLLENNFILCNGRFGEYYKHSIFDSFRIWIENNVFNVGKKDLSCNVTFCIKEDLKYFHDLQNLFELLTNSEL